MKSCYKEVDFWSGDGSVNYFYFPEVPKRIKYFVPESKLILMLRNPIDRVYSNYWMNYRQFQNTSVKKWNSFDEFIANDGHKNEINQYSISLKRWLKYFKPNEILILKSEEFFSDTFNTLKIVENYLNISTYNYPNEHWVTPHSNKGNDYPKMNGLTRKLLAQYFTPFVRELEDLTGINFNWKDFN